MRWGCLGGGKKCVRDEDTKRRRMGKATVLFLRRRFWENLSSEGRERHKREQRKGWI